jgi:hypothetical protein
MYIFYTMIIIVVLIEFIYISNKKKVLPLKEVTVLFNQVK